MIKCKLHHYQPIYPKYLLFVLDVSLDVGGGPGIRVRDGVLGITMISHQKMESFLITWKELLLIRVLSFWWNSSLAIQSSSDKRRHEFTFSSPPLPVRRFNDCVSLLFWLAKTFAEIFAKFFQLNFYRCRSNNNNKDTRSSHQQRSGSQLPLLWFPDGQRNKYFSFLSLL